MEKLHVAVVDPAGRHPELDCFNQLAKRNPDIFFSYHLPAMFGMDSLEDINLDPNAIIVLGSSASVHDQLAWQEDLSRWLFKQIEANKAILGICYGHQLLAHMYNSKIDYVDSGEKLTGSREVKISKKGFWGDIETTYRWVVSHRECVSKLSSKLVNIASSETVECEAFAHSSKPIWGVQAHPEANMGFLRNQSIIIPDEEHQIFSDGPRFMQAFLKHIQTLSR